MYNEMKDATIDSIQELSVRAKVAKSSDEAMRFGQAALNLAQALNKVAEADYLIVSTRGIPAGE